MTTLYVAVGGVLGVLARFGIGRASLQHEWLLWSTVGINIVGSFLLALLMAKNWLVATCAGASASGSLGASRRSRRFRSRPCLKRAPESPLGPSSTCSHRVIGELLAATAGYALGRSLA